MAVKVATKSGKAARKPRIVVAGVEISDRNEAGTSGKTSRTRRILAVIFFGIAILGALAAGAGLLSSCSGRLGADISAGGGADIAVSAEIPLPVAEKLRRLAGLPERAPLFDSAALRSSLSRRQGLSIRSLESPSPESVRVAVAVRNLAELLADPELAGAGLLALRTEGEEFALRLRLDRETGGSISALLPGMDPLLLDALAPPALEGESISRAEYRSMLASIFGEKLMPYFDAARVSLRIAAPGPVTAAEGGTLSGRTLSADIPLLDLLVLEKPIDIALRWKR